MEVCIYRRTERERYRKRDMNVGKGRWNLTEGPVHQTGFKDNREMRASDGRIDSN